jgi:hypothetical protein
MMLPPDKVLPHLQALSSSLVTPYLEFLMEHGEKEAAFHNELVFNYLETITKLKQDPSYRSSTICFAPTTHCSSSRIMLTCGFDSSTTTSGLRDRGI